MENIFSLSASDVIRTSKTSFLISQKGRNTSSRWLKDCSCFVVYIIVDIWHIILVPLINWTSLIAAILDGSMQDSWLIFLIDALIVFANLRTDPLAIIFILDTSFVWLQKYSLPKLTLYYPGRAFEDPVKVYCVRTKEIEWNQRCTTHKITFSHSLWTGLVCLLQEFL